VCINAQSDEQTVRPAETQFAGKSSKSRGLVARTEMECRPVSPFVVHPLRSRPFSSFLHCQPYICVHTIVNTIQDLQNPLRQLFQLPPYLRFYSIDRGSLFEKSFVLWSKDLVDRYLWYRHSSKCVSLSVTFIAFSDVHSSGIASRIFHSTLLACETANVDRNSVLYKSGLLNNVNY